MFFFLYALQPIVNAENPTLYTTINKLSSSLGSWKSEAEKYKDLIIQAYSMNDKAGKKFTSQVDALAMTYHQRVGLLQSLLSQIKDEANTAHSASSTIAQSLETLDGDFDKIDPYVDRLEADIDKVSQLATFAGKIDGVFSPLKCLIKKFDCVGDDNNIKKTQMVPLKVLLDLSGKFYSFGLALGFSEDYATAGHVTCVVH